MKRKIVLTSEEILEIARYEAMKKSYIPRGFKVVMEAGKAKIVPTRRRI